MGNRISDWLLGEPIPRELHVRVMGDRRLSTAGGGALRTRVAFATAALVVLLVGGGLGSILLRGTHPGGAAAVVAGSPSPSATPTLAPLVTTPTPSATADLAQAPCHTVDLTINLGPALGAAGTRFVAINAMNHSSRTCTLTGYFGLALLDASGKQIGGDPARDPDAHPQQTTITLNPDTAGQFLFHWSDVQSSAQPCPVAAQVELTAPDQYDHVFLPARTADGVSIAPCSPGGTGVTTVHR